MEDEFFEDSLLVGVACPVSSYRLCWLLNRTLNFSFYRKTKMDIELISKESKGKKEKIVLPVYHYLSPFNGPRYTLYQLKVGSLRLLPELKALDYLVMVQSGTPEETTAQFAQYLKQIPLIQLAQIINPLELKSRNNLLV
ncbi:MAG: IPExxxVDY family protein [Chitinophagaceae bacterium]